MRPASEYCSLTLMLSGLDPSMPAFVELLGSGDKLERTALVENGRAYFPFPESGEILRQDDRRPQRQRQIRHRRLLHP